MVIFVAGLALATCVMAGFTYFRRGLTEGRGQLTAPQLFAPGIDPRDLAPVFAIRVTPPTYQPDTLSAALNALVVCRARQNSRIISKADLLVGLPSDVHSCTWDSSGISIKC
jgi:hypothetical protein